MIDNEFRVFDFNETDTLRVQTISDNLFLIVFIQNLVFFSAAAAHKKWMLCGSWAFEELLE